MRGYHWKYIIVIGTLLLLFFVISFLTNFTKGRRPCPHNQQKIISINS